MGIIASALVAMTFSQIEDYELYKINIDGENFCNFLKRCVMPILQPFNGTNRNSVVVLTIGQCQDSSCS